MHERVGRKLRTGWDARRHVGHHRRPRYWVGHRVVGLALYVSTYLR
jgi:hypothetical protein